LGVIFVMLSSAQAASRRAVLRGLTSAGSLIVLGGCATLPAVLPTLNAAEPSASPTVLVATTRKAASGAKEKPWFGFERSSRISVARARIAAPARGRFSLSAVGVEIWRLDEVDLAPRLSDLLAQNGPPRDVLVHVHGFNHTFEQSVIAAARLADGIEFRGETLAFSWPSKGSLFDYGYDRESAMWSRDGLERVLTRLIENPNVARIHIVAHSIGTMVAMEALRQTYARRGPPLVARLGAVVFAAPDIDMDVFRSSVERVSALASRITVVVASNDRALAVSGWIAGTTRVGTADKDELKGMGLQVIDASHEGWGVINHDLFMSDANIRNVIRRAIDGQRMNET
jgi:esterase/lipase superfamily enzyme